MAKAYVIELSERVDALEAENKQLREALRDLCMGHVDDCRCRHCLLVFDVDRASHREGEHEG